MNDKIILAVDDSEIDLLILQKLLTNYQIICIHNSNEVISYLLNNEVDLILMDIEMPELDGFDLCKMIKQNNKINHIPIIFLSSCSAVDTIVKTLNVGAVDFVTKPFIKEELNARVQTQLNLVDNCNNLIKVKEYEVLKKIIVRINHEFNNQLSIIYSSIFLINKTPENQKELLNKIQSATYKMKEVLQKLNSLTKIATQTYQENIDMLVLNDD